jgi:hypothetical protein
MSIKRYAASELQPSFTREDSETVLMSRSNSLIAYSYEKSRSALSIDLKLFLKCSDVFQQIDEIEVSYSLLSVITKEIINTAYILKTQLVSIK